MTRIARLRSALAGVHTTPGDDRLIAVLGEWGSDAAVEVIAGWLDRVRLAGPVRRPDDDTPWPPPLEPAQPAPIRDPALTQED